MGAMAEAFVAYAQPLIDQTDGSHEQLNKAFAISQLCYNLALLPEDQREQSLSKMRPSLHMNDEEFDEFLGSILAPMIRRHEEMFPFMHRRGSAAAAPSSLFPLVEPRESEPAKPDRSIDRYAPCPCNSGEKYKFCCGKKRR